MSEELRLDGKQQNNQQQQQQQKSRRHQRHHQVADSDHTEAVAPVEVSRFSVEPPKYDSPGASRQSLRGSEAGEQEGSSVPVIPGGAAARGSQKKKGKAAQTSYRMERQPAQRQRLQNEDEAPDEQPQGNRCCEILLTAISVILIILTFPFSMCACIKIVQQYERAVIMRLGRVQGEPKGPGLFFIIKCIDNAIVVDLRTVTFDVPPQEILTKDSVTVAVDAVVYYRIFDPIKATIDIEDVHRATRLLAQTTLRNILGTKTLHEILGEREVIALAMQETLDVATDPWGVKVERVEVKDVRLPTQMQRAMAAEAEALREAKAKVIAAEGEQKASRSLKEAADVIGSSDAALQLRYLQTLNTIAAEKNSTIIFPLPMDLLGAALGKK